MEKQIDELWGKMEVLRPGACPVREGTERCSPEEKTDIVSARLLQLNTEYTAAQADRVRKEAMFNAMKTVHWPRCRYRARARISRSCRTASMTCSKIAERRAEVRIILTSRGHSRS